MGGIDDLHPGNENTQKMIPKPNQNMTHAILSEDLSLKNCFISFYLGQTRYPILMYLYPS